MRRLMIVITALAVFGAACGDDGGDATDAGTTTTTTIADDSGGDETTTTTTTEAVAEFNISEVEQSVVQIQTQGTYEFIQGTAANAGATGTGFVISEDGLVVTNNHVVTGAATLAVSFSGEDPINARVLGVSECSDLAVIQLTGSGYTPLTFRDDPVTVGLDVFSAGYPGADDPDFDNLDYTLTAGIVGSVEADGESSWASVDSVIQHDAQILGGNSGGPLVDENGQVVGINYAGNDDFNTNFAITAEDARPVIDSLANGISVDSIGINGQATVFDNGLTGIWIRSVDSGSPADAAGIEAGDLLTTFENLVMATDGSMADYCDVLRSNTAESTMNFEIYRPSLDLLLEGQINGDPIEIPVFTQTVVEGTGGGTSDGTTGSGAAPVSYDYVTVSDDSGRISVSVPTAWAQVDGSENPNFGPSIWAAPDIEAWQNSWGTPGIIVESSPTLTSANIPELLAARDFSSVCNVVGDEPYEDALYSGTMRIYNNCGGGDTIYVVLAASPLDPAQDYLIRVEIQAVTQADLEAGDTALNTFIANI